MTPSTLLIIPKKYHYFPAGCLVEIVILFAPLLGFARNSYTKGNIYYLFSPVVVVLLGQ